MIVTCLLVSCKTIPVGARCLLKTSLAKLPKPKVLELPKPTLLELPKPQLPKVPKLKVPKVPEIPKPTLPDSYMMCPICTMLLLLFLTTMPQCCVLSYVHHHL